MGKSLFIGRRQPFHEVHKSLIDVVLKEGKKVVIAVRDTPISEDNPHSAEERVKNIRHRYKQNPNVEVITIPDITEVCYGRNVGWTVRRIRSKKVIEEISETKIRPSNKGIIWLTGNVGAGKTSLAYLLKDRLSAIVLDGDELRSSISNDLGFGKQDRDEHNLRAARLALILNNQGFNVVVAVIAPFQSTRNKITKLINPYWIHVKGGRWKGKNMPYEIPKNPHLVINPTRESLLTSLDKIIKKIGKLPNSEGTS